MLILIFVVLIIGRIIYCVKRKKTCFILIFDIPLFFLVAIIIFSIIALYFESINIHFCKKCQNENIPKLETQIQEIKENIINANYSQKNLDELLIEYTEVSSTLEFYNNLVEEYSFYKLNEFQHFIFGFQPFGDLAYRK